MAQEPGTQHYMVLQEVEQPPAKARGPGAVDRRRRDRGHAAGRLQVVDGTMQKINGNERTSASIAATPRTSAR